jgi:hypothetical protein
VVHPWAFDGQKHRKQPLTPSANASDCVLRRGVPSPGLFVHLPSGAGLVRAWLVYIPGFHGAHRLGFCEGRDGVGCFGSSLRRASRTRQLPRFQPPRLCAPLDGGAGLCLTDRRGLSHGVHCVRWRSATAQNQQRSQEACSKIHRRIVFLYERLPDNFGKQQDYGGMILRGCRSSAPSVLPVATNELDAAERVVKLEALHGGALLRRPEAWEFQRDHAAYEGICGWMLDCW